MVKKRKVKTVEAKKPVEKKKKEEKKMRRFGSLKDPKKESQRIFTRRLILSLIVGVIVSTVTWVFNRDVPVSVVVFWIVTGLSLGNFYFREKLKASARIKKIEEIFPDFLQLMSSNLRAGITIDRAMLLSAREEFEPLDKEILKTGRDITTGKNIEGALLALSKRVNSERVSKTILLIISGIKSGGDVATLLEQTAEHMREKSFLEKKASSNVLMYVIFIFLAVAFGAPALFGLSNILVEILTALLGDLPELDASVSTPFTLSAINISVKFVFYFSLLFILVIDILASLTLGLVSKGSEKEGLKYAGPLIAISYAMFFLIKYALSGFVAGFFG